MLFRLQDPTQLKSFIEGLRKQAGYTQKEVGILLGISQQAYQKMERNPERVSFERIMHIMKLFNASIAVEYNGEPDSRKDDLQNDNQTNSIDGKQNSALAQRKISKINPAIEGSTELEKEDVRIPTEEPDTGIAVKSKATLIIKATGIKPKW